MMSIDKHGSYYLPRASDGISCKTTKVQSSPYYTQTVPKQQETRLCTYTNIDFLYATVVIIIGAVAACVVALPLTISPGIGPYELAIPPFDASLKEVVMLMMIILY